MTNMTYNSNAISPVFNLRNQTKWLASFVLFCVFISALCSISNASDDFTAEKSCEAVASEAEEAFSLPEGILTSIARVESGRKMQDGSYRAWPWTINDNGKGLFFDTRQSAIDYIDKQKKLDNTSIDIGCMQISVKWHAHAFSTNESMLDPYTNIAYAAIFLEELYQNHGDWDSAIKHYHSADKEKNVPYLRKVNAIWKNQPEPKIEPSTASANYASSIQPKNSSHQEIIRNNKANSSLKNSPIDDINETVIHSVGISSTVEEEIILFPSEEITQKHSYEIPSEKFAQTQPYLANEWDKIVHFRKLFSTE